MVLQAPPPAKIPGIWASRKQDSFGDIGTAKIVGVNSRSEKSFVLAIYLPADYYTVFWLGKLEKIFIPNTVFTTTCSIPVHRNGTQVYISFNSICMFPYTYEKGFKSGGFASAGFPNTSSGLFCCPSLYLEKKTYKQLKDIDKYITKLREASIKEDRTAVRDILGTVPMKFVSNKIVARALNTNFNTDYTQTGWPFSKMRSTHKEELYFLRTSQRLSNKTAEIKYYQTLTKEDIEALPAIGVRRRKLENLI